MHCVHSSRHESMLDTCFHHVTGGEGGQLQSNGAVCLQQALHAAHVLTVTLGLCAPVNSAL